jgi:hypothetical protein
MRFLLVLVALVRLVPGREVTEPQRPYQFLRCLQLAAVVAGAYRINKRDAMEDAEAEQAGADQQQQEEQGAKDLTVVLSPTLSRHSLARVAVVQAQSAQTVARCVVLAAMVRHTSELLMRVAAVLANLLALGARAVAAAAVLAVTLSEQQEQQIQAAAAALLVVTIQLAEEAAAQAVAVLLFSVIPARQSPPLLAQQTRQHNPAGSPSIRS